MIKLLLTLKFKNKTFFCNNTNKNKKLLKELLQIHFNEF